MLIPIQKEASNHLILGALLVLRSLALHFPSLSSHEVKPSAQTFFDKGGGGGGAMGSKGNAELVLTFDQVIQVCNHKVN